MTSEYAVRYTNTVLYDSHGEKHQGDYLIHDDGSWSNSNGDEDVTGSRWVKQSNYSVIAELAHAFGYAT